MTDSVMFAYLSHLRILVVIVLFRIMQPYNTFTSVVMSGALSCTL